jgi:hypothetical protein
MKKAIFPIGGFSGMALGAIMSASIGIGEPAGPMFALALGFFGMVTAYATTTKIDAGERGPQIEALARRLAEIGEDAVQGKLGEGDRLRRLRSSGADLSPDSPRTPSNN